MGTGVAAGVSEWRRLFSRPRAIPLPTMNSNIPMTRMLLNQSQRVLGLLSVCVNGAADLLKFFRGRKTGGLEATGDFFAKTGTPHIKVVNRTITNELIHSITPIVSSFADS